MNTTNTSARKPRRCPLPCPRNLSHGLPGCRVRRAVHAADKSSDSEPMKKTVKYGDLNLANPQGVEQLYRRIVGAARQVCEYPGRPFVAGESNSSRSAPNSRLRAPWLRLTSRH